MIEALNLREQKTTNNLNRVLLIYEGFPDLELPGILAIKWVDKSQSGRRRVRFILFRNRR